MLRALMLCCYVASLEALSLAAPPRNCALVFLKPHAANDACEAFVRSHLASSGINIVATGEKRGDEIDGSKLID